MPRVGDKLCPRHPREDKSLSEIAVFGGSAHPDLAAEICAHLEVALLPTRLQHFANDCLEVAEAEFRPIYRPST